MSKSNNTLLILGVAVAAYIVYKRYATTITSGSQTTAATPGTGAYDSIMANTYLPGLSNPATIQPSVAGQYNSLLVDAPSLQFANLQNSGS